MYPEVSLLYSFIRVCHLLHTASTSQESHQNSSTTSSSSKTLEFTLLSSEWRSTKGGLSTINQELAIQLAEHPSIEVCVYLPQCTEEDKRVASSHNVHLIGAEEMVGYDDPVEWLSSLPEGHTVYCVIGHGAVLGQQLQFVKCTHPHCKWIQIVHTAPEDLGMYKRYADVISRGERKHQAEVKLCEKADQVVAVGPKLAEAFSGYLRFVRCFIESREQLARLFCEADLAIMPSRTEGFGLTALEALSAGLPVLVSGNSGLGEALKKVPFASSCVVDSEDPKDWANAIRNAF